MNERLVLLDESEARAIARRWASRDSSPLGGFASYGKLAGGIMDEVSRVYLGKLAPAERIQVSKLGMYLAARSWYEEVGLRERSQRDSD